jgi:glucose-6-phosphate 1-epimerase
LPSPFHLVTTHPIQEKIASITAGGVVLHQFFKILFRISEKMAIYDEFVTSEGLVKVKGSLDGDSSIELYLFGGHITSWVNAGRERLWMSNSSVMDGSAPLRGGIPLCFPQFADNGSIRMHGFVREMVWTLVPDECSKNEDALTIVLRLDSNETTNKLWNDSNHPFSLKYTINLTRLGLDIALQVTNTDMTNSMQFTNCFHPYFRVDNSSYITIQGLHEQRFIDKVDKKLEKIQNSIELNIFQECEESNKATPEYFVDRIYENCAVNPLILLQNGVPSLELAKSTNWRDWVVFNPWKDGKKGAKGPDFDDDGYNYMICIEPTNATTPFSLAPNTSVVFSQNTKVLN